jgi:geranylgeranyl diphosphate synthase type II
MNSISPVRAVASPIVMQTVCPDTARRTWIDLRLNKLLPKTNAGPQPLIEAVRSVCLGQGKRVRPSLAMMSAAHFGGREMAALDFGCALEFIHTASLILDDLPCMDDAAMRRGRPTLHRQFGEDTAVLCAVALLNHAYAVIAEDKGLDAEIRLSLQRLVSESVGFQGLVAGQIRDLREPEATRDEAVLTGLNHQKTGVLFVAAMVGGALIAGAEPAAQTQARVFARRLGVAFQLWDDLQDFTSTLEIMGKDARQDDGRVTFVTLWGVDRTRAMVAETLDGVLAALGEPDCPLAVYVLNLFRQTGYDG